MLFETRSLDEELRQKGYILIAGVDEAGRGPLAGPVFAAAVILPPDNGLPPALDSKNLSPARREKLCLQIEEEALAWQVARIEHSVIDEINILRATLKAMVEAVKMTAFPAVVRAVVMATFTSPHFLNSSWIRPMMYRP